MSSAPPVAVFCGRVPVVRRGGTCALPIALRAIRRVRGPFDPHERGDHFGIKRPVNRHVGLRPTGSGVRHRPLPYDNGDHDAESTWVIGIDVGGTKIAGGLVEVNTGDVLAKRIVPTMRERGGEAVLVDVIAVAEELDAEARARGGAVIGVGVGVPELVDGQGTIRSGNVSGLEGMPIQERLERIAPVVVEADVRAAALAEARYGAGRAFGLFAYVTVGTGISCCLVQDGRPFAGARGNALVLASAPLTVRCDACGAWASQVLEEYASGPALVARYRQRTGRPVESAEEVLAAVEGGDEVAVDVVRSAGQALGSSVGFLVNVLDPEAVIVGGGLGVAGGLYWESFVQSTRAHIWSEATRELPMLPAALGADAGLIGAAVAAADAPVRTRR